MSDIDNEAVPNEAPVRSDTQVSDLTVTPTTKPPKSDKPKSKPAKGVTTPAAGGAGFVPKQKPMSAETLVNPSMPPAYTFADGYDLKRQFARVKHLVLSHEPDPLDPLHSSYLAYLKRVNDLNTELSILASRRYVQDGVDAAVANRIGTLGALVADEEYGEDTLEIHTDIALRLFTGVQPGIRSDGSKNYPVDGALRAGAALKTIVVAAREGNPYAEMSLLQIEAQLADIEACVVKYQAKYQALLDKSAKRGLSLTVLKSKTPVDVKVTFKTPYGFKLAALVAEADSAVLLSRTMDYRGLLVNTETRKDIAVIAAAYRDLFQSIVRLSFIFNDVHVAAITRADWVMYQLTRSNPNITDPAHTANFVGESSEAKQAKAIALKLRAVGVAEHKLGQLPEDVLIGTKQPSYVNIKVSISPAERKLMTEILGNMRNA